MWRTGVHNADAASHLINQWKHSGKWDSRFCVVLEIGHQSREVTFAPSKRLDRNGLELQIQLVDGGGLEIFHGSS